MCVCVCVCVCVFPLNKLRKSVILISYFITLMLNCGKRDNNEESVLKTSLMVTGLTLNCSSCLINYFDPDDSREETKILNNV